MTTPNRAALLNKIHKVLKRSHKYTATKGDQPLLESLLFACCLENTHHDVARDQFDKLRAAFFDWNEIRVSTAKELAEVIDKVSEPLESAARLKSILQSVFESDYSFDLEHFKKQNIGAAVKRLQKCRLITPFVVAYATQTALGGHAIPLDKGTLGALYVLGVISEADAAHGIVPGMERAIPKSKGQEFASLLHELGADFFANPFSTSLRELLLSIAPDAKERFPKRHQQETGAEPATLAAAAKPSPAQAKRKQKEAEAAKKAAKRPEKRAPAPSKPRLPRTARRNQPPPPKNGPPARSPSASRAKSRSAASLADALKWQAAGRRSGPTPAWTAGTPRLLNRRRTR